MPRAAPIGHCVNHHCECERLAVLSHGTAMAYPWFEVGGNSPMVVSHHIRSGRQRANLRFHSDLLLATMETAQPMLPLVHHSKILPPKLEAT